jgi:hypothetical protein
MATQGIDYQSVFLDRCEDVHSSINGILHNIHDHFLNHRPHKHYLALTNRHFNRCYSSWNHLEPKLKQFVHNPKSHYSTIMWSIQKDLNRLPMNNFYTKELRKLAGLLSQGPQIEASKIHFE